MPNPNKTPLSQGKTVAFIDGDNLYFSVKSLRVALDFVKFRNLLIQSFGEGTVAYYYLTIDPSMKRQTDFLSVLREIGYKVRSHPVRKIRGSVRYSSGIDIQLAVDAVSISRNFEKVILVSGDGDLLPVLRTLKESGRKVILLSLPIVTSRKLRKEADQFLNLEEWFSESGRAEAVGKGERQTAANEKALKEYYLEKGLYYDSYVLIRELVRLAKWSVMVTDNYINEEVLHLLSGLDKAVKLRIITSQVKGDDFFVLLRKLKREGRDIDVYRCEMFHDRWIEIDDELWHLGHSIKDLGSGDAMIQKVSELSCITKVRERVQEVYRTSGPLNDRR